MSNENTTKGPTSPEAKAVGRWVDVARSAGFASVLTCGILSLPAVALEVLSLVKIRKLDGGRKAMLSVISTMVVSVAFAGIGFVGWSAYSTADAMAKHINCVNHLQRLATGLRLFAGENGDHYPYATNWCEALRTYSIVAGSALDGWGTVLATNEIPEELRCPASSRAVICSYAFNEKLSGKREGDVTPDTVMLFESNGGWNASGSLSNAVAHHSGILTTVAFADGSVRQIRFSELEKLRWDP